MITSFIRDFSQTKALFQMPADMIYLDGNSLGPLPRAAAARINDCVTREWGEMVITGWNRAGWMAQPTTYADRIGRLIGAETGHCVLGDTLSVKVYQALAAALDLVPDRRVILTDSGNFPSDIYMAEGLIKSLDRGYELRVVAPQDVADHIDSDLAVLMLTQVDYRTGRMHDMAALTQKAHDAGAITIWDLAHSAGALPVDVAGCGADFAVGCTYKYLNGGPGAPAFIYVAPRHIDRCEPALSGWLGHAAPFAFEAGYRPGTGIERMRVGTPPVLQLAALDASLDIWDRVDLHDIRKASIALTDQFIAGIEAACPMLTLASPRDPAQRGSQVSFRFADGYAAMQACIAHGVVGDFRAPDIMRFGFTPLFIDAGDVARAVEIIAKVMTDKLWDRAEFRQKAAVT
ncbi:kynureninase [Yoonia vestfoldensis]|uniref:Kynureninase n=1 Tax=Yoonia vestfoldensis SKA53 TaxID=314232 RepID=A3V7P3_9RHOB|nr:kynureninase [Yoonia vestfoldensis]EAQ05693.1 kynureninase [Yoonia vestfoldensis SKA53]